MLQMRTSVVLLTEAVKTSVSTTSAPLAVPVPMTTSSSPMATHAKVHNCFTIGKPNTVINMHNTDS